MLMISVMFAGIAIGYFFNTEKFIKINEKLQLLLVSVLVFIMGTAAGQNMVIFENLDDIVVNSLILSVIPTFISILFVYILSRLLVKEDKNKHK